MKKRKLCLCIAFLCLFLSACGKKTQTASAFTVPVGIAEADWITVQNNGQWVAEGQDAVFSLIAKDNFHVTGADYDGEYTLTQNENRVLLTLKNVCYPAQVHLEGGNEVWELTYEPNGAPGEAVTVYEEKGVHLRPNTSAGTELFSWEGHTLLGWNTEADGSGTDAGLGSRVSVPDGKLTLYARWAEWTLEEEFSWEEKDGEAVITGCRAETEILVIPEEIEGLKVTGIAEGALTELPFRVLSLPSGMKTVEDGAVRNCALEELYLSDSVESISNAAFEGCEGWKTVHINAEEKPFGTCRYKESCYADKADLLILAQGKPKLVFYAGCSVWYNLDISQVKAVYGDRYQIIDMGLNGTVSSELQLQILNAFLEEGDVFFHTPELSSPYQMMEETELSGSDGVLWSGLEYNYDLVSLVDAQSVGDLLGSLTAYLADKYAETDYSSCFEDTSGTRFCGENGEIPFIRTKQKDGELEDEVNLTPDSITDIGMKRLRAWYESFSEKGVSVFVSYSALNTDALTGKEKDELGAVEARFQRSIQEMKGAVLISKLQDYEYRESDFYDTNYHLLTNPAVKCTRRWLADLSALLPAGGEGLF